MFHGQLKSTPNFSGQLLILKKPSKIPSSAYETTGSPMGALLKTYQNMWSLPTINLDHVLRVSPWVPHIYVNVYPREILSLINNALHFDG